MPTTRGRKYDEQASGTIPRRAKTNPKRAFSLAMRMSIGSVIVTPTPTAGPLIAPMTGFLQAKIRSETSPPPSRGTPESAITSLPPRLNVSPPPRRPPRGGDPAAAPGADRPPATRQVGPGAEPPTGAGDDHGAHVVVGV